MQAVKGGYAVMAGRREPPSALDFFPTPPWATRALFEHVLPSMGMASIGSVWEPACGEGHMCEVIREYCTNVIASDVFDYGNGYDVTDFLDTTLQPSSISADWIVTNPPFASAERFALLSLERAHIGVALLLRTLWIETAGRYETIFRPRPPTLFAPFVERCAMIKGRWDPDASTATAYAWFVWARGLTPRAPFWIPPGCRTRLTRPNDRKRFAGR
jgi:hypothetical protein